MSLEKGRKRQAMSAADLLLRLARHALQLGFPLPMEDNRRKWQNDNRAAIATPAPRPGRIAMLRRGGRKPTRLRALAAFRSRT